MVLFTLIVAGFAILAPGSADAWGAATHLKLAEHVLLNRTALPAQLGALLGQYPAFFAYGNIIADLILGKRYGIDYRDHSHNWQVAFRLADEAQTPELKAAMWGYLSHLAADVIAHHIYVPTKLAAAEPGLIRGHMGWEMVFDLDWGGDYLPTAARLEKDVGRFVDPFLTTRLKRTLFSHKTNKRIFSGTLQVQQIGGYRRLLSGLAKRRPHLPVDNTRADYLDRSLGAIANLAAGERRAAIVAYDPTGQQKLEWATLARRKGQAGDITLYGPDGRPLDLPRVREQFAKSSFPAEPHAFGQIELQKATLHQIVT